MPKTYFAVLGIQSTASPEEIRSAYRKLAKAFHPDRYEGGSTPFMQIQEAYSVLGDEDRRREYKRSLDTPRAEEARKPAGPMQYPAPEPLIPERGPVDLGDISPVRSFRTFKPSFDALFEFLRDGPHRSERFENLTLEVPLTRDQATRGGSARILAPARAVCPTCRGGGGIGFYVCTGCAGQGRIYGEAPISVAFPAGLGKDYAVVVPLDGLGLPNLHLTVLFRPTEI